MSKINTAYCTWRDEGLLSLIRETADWMAQKISHWYYIQRGFQTFQIGSVTAEFDTSSEDTINKTRWMHELEKEEVARVLNELQEDDIFFDIGANLGLYTAFASKKITQGKVHAFEPYPPNIKILRKNANRNGKNIHIHEIALSNSSGTTKFQQADESVGSQVGAIAPKNKNTAYEVETASIDELVSTDKIPIPDVVKIDVEGAEPLVLDGMKKILKQNACRAVFCEIHPPTNNSRPSIQDFDSSTEDISDIFISNGYSVDILDLNRGEDLLIAKV